MKRLFATCVLFTVLCGISWGKVLRGFDGGMMVHTGYLSGEITPLNYKASGVPLGIGGVIRLHLDEHWRLGTEGYFSSLRQMNNGSYVKYGWGGILADYYWEFGRFMPYIGLTIGGGGLTDLLIMKEAPSQWGPVEKAYYAKQGFMAIDPFIGCDFIATKALHITLKLDCLCGIGRDLHMPMGPRLYLGFIFYH